MTLATFAMDVRDSRGRRYAEASHPYRNEYARDRDRVIHARAFRRLEAKTQVFTTRFSDHFRNRLTHTLEVAQIARTVAAAMDLNSDLAEALALVHDIGHPPFGHEGERRLDRRMREHGERFDHNLHALRIVEKFEQSYLDFSGLNLTFEVREGIVKHSRDYAAAEYPDLAEYLLDQRPPLEAQLIDLVDEIAYNTADLDDGREAHLIDIDEARAAVPLFGEKYAEVERSYPGGKPKLIFNEALRRILDYLATDLIQQTLSRVNDTGIRTVEELRRDPVRLASFSAEAGARNTELKQFLYTKLYNLSALVDERERSAAALDELFQYYMDHPDAMPDSYRQQFQFEPAHRIVCDYIAGMTDQYLLRQHQERLAGPPPKRSLSR
jgi:dGTPase